MAQAQQSAFQGTWIRDFTPKYYAESDDYRLEISETAWSFFIGGIIQGAGTATFSVGGAELLLANGSIYSSLTLLAPGYIQASGKINFSFRILDVALVEAKAVEFANAYYKSGNYFMSLAYADNWFKYYAGAPSFLSREIYECAMRLLWPPGDLIKEKEKFDKGDYDGAIADFTEVIRLIPNYVYAYKQRGVAYSRKGDYDRAIADFEAALRINPNLAKETRDEIERDLELARQARGR
jgi:tetratricopeptide (TPR) repeat protein